MASAWTRCAPSATNISPTTDLPDAMLPVRPTFSNPPPTEIALPQRRRDAEKMQKPKRALSSVLLYLCIERFHLLARSGTWLPRRIFAAFTVLYISIAMVSGPTPPGRGEGSCNLNHLGMHIADQSGSLRQEILFALGIVLLSGRRTGAEIPPRRSPCSCQRRSRWHQA